MNLFEYWLILAACVMGWIAWDTRSKALAYFTQWKMQLDKDLDLRWRDFEALEIQAVTWVRDGEDFETWCAAVDHYMDEELRGFPA